MSDDAADPATSGTDGNAGDAATAADDGDGEDSGTGGRPCPFCETPMYRRHCKYVCPNHGVVYDCSDTFW